MERYLVVDIDFNSNILCLDEWKIVINWKKDKFIYEKIFNL